ncbi:MAG: pyridoxal-phosphate dependent enzyme [Halobacteriaceae archaeon]
MTLFTCSACKRDYKSGKQEPWRCQCGNPLDFKGELHPGQNTIPPVLERKSLWDFAPFLPIDKRVSFGEGWTPIVESPEWGASFKLEFLFPTNSFKDRGATVLLSRASNLGVKKVAEDSSGNAGAAIATYAARAGIDAEIFVPADVKREKVKAIERTGATINRVNGTREDVTKSCINSVESNEWWYASHIWRPSFLAGTATMAYEIAPQRNWRAPDVLVLPIGHGTLLLGAYRGFKSLYKCGWIDKIPRLCGVQASGYAPFVNDGAEQRNEIADGIQIRDPVRKQEVEDAIDQTRGSVIAVGENQVGRELERLQNNGYYVEPTAAVAPAGLNVYREKGTIAGDDEVIVPLTGSGYKS